MSIRFGVSPIAWINDDMPELGGDTLLSTVLRDSRDIGFDGIELGGKFPRNAAVLEATLAPYNLSLVAGWYSGNLLNQTVEAEIESLQAHLDLLKAMGSTVFVFAETSNAIHSKRGVPLSSTPRMQDDDWKQFGARVTGVADYITGQGFRFAYHHHLGTVVENSNDLAAFFRETGSCVGLTLDTGHAALGGIDPVSVIEAHPERIAHVHCKDARLAVHQSIRVKDYSFLDGVLAGMFTVPGDGNLEFAAVMTALKVMNYSGWIIVEAEQDPKLADPRVFAELGLRTLKREASAAGLI